VGKGTCNSTQMIQAALFKLADGSFQSRFVQILDWKVKTIIFILSVLGTGGAGNFWRKENTKNINNAG
jgi:hypothetical protein